MRGAFNTTTMLLALFRASVQLRRVWEVGSCIVLREKSNHMTPRPAYKFLRLQRLSGKTLRIPINTFFEDSFFLSICLREHVTWSSEYLDVIAKALNEGLERWLGV